MVLRVEGVDYESLDSGEQEYAVKRLEAALKSFGTGFHVYQYLLKRNRPEIPFEHHENPVVETAIDQRRELFARKQDALYQIDLYYVVLLEGSRSKRGLGVAFTMLFSDPAGACREIATRFSQNRTKAMLRFQIEACLTRLDQRVEAFTRQLVDFVQITALARADQFTFFRRLLNFDAARIAGRPQSTQFLDYQVVNSDIVRSGIISAWATILSEC
jgi:type IV secretion system protein TrbE